MRTTGNHRDPVNAQFSRCYRLTRRPHDPERLTFLDIANVDIAAYGTPYNAECWLVILNQSYVHGKFAVSIDEFACPVQGIHKPVASPALAHSKARRVRLFRNHRYR